MTGAISDAGRSRPQWQAVSGLAFLLAVSVAAGCAPVPPTPPNVLLITIDTMRADRLERGGLTPTLDRLAARGTRFTHAYAHAPTTLSSHATILTGLLPTSHGVRNNGAFRLDARFATLAERLQENGYTAGAYVSAFVLDSRFGLGQGFAAYDDRVGSEPARSAAAATFRFSERRASDTLKPATAWIAQQTGPWFAWVHLFDPHAPYAAPTDGAAVPDNVDRAYDAEIAYVDRMLEGFFTALKAVLDRTSDVPCCPAIGADSTTVTVNTRRSRWADIVALLLKNGGVGSDI